MRKRGRSGVSRWRGSKGCTANGRTIPARMIWCIASSGPTAQGWLYLAVVIDAWSRRLVGWSIADQLHAELLVDAINMAIMRRRPAGSTVHDRLRPPNPAVAESFFGSLYCELLDRHRWPTRAGLARPQPPPQPLTPTFQVSIRRPGSEAA
jgi:putative transposase